MNIIINHHPAFVTLPHITQNRVSYKFGIVAMLSGVVGVPLGSYLAQRFRPTHPNCDPHICAVGLFISSPMVFMALYLARTNETWCLIFVFLGEVALNLCWSIVADILLVSDFGSRKLSGGVCWWYGVSGGVCGVLSHSNHQHHRHNDSHTHTAINLHHIQTSRRFCELELYTANWQQYKNNPIRRIWHI